MADDIDKLMDEQSGDPETNLLELVALLMEKYGYWGEPPDFPVEDWKYEVANGDTRVSYWEWVARGMTDA